MSRRGVEVESLPRFKRSRFDLRQDGWVPTQHFEEVLVATEIQQLLGTPCADHT